MRPSLPTLAWLVLVISQIGIVNTNTIPQKQYHNSYSSDNSDNNNKNSSTSLFKRETLTQPKAIHDANPQSHSSGAGAVHDGHGGPGVVHNGPGGEPHGDGHHGGIHLASWRWSEYNTQMMFTLMIVCVAIFKIIFHHLHWLSRILPESCVLIVVGIITAVFIHYVVLDEMLHLDSSKGLPFPVFTSDLFFNVLLPPIILDSALALYDRDFFENFASIMIFAVFGTLFNVFSIGYSLYGMANSGLLGTFVTNSTEHGLQEHQLQATECLIFSSLISAVDPVAVLAIFEEIHVNQGLYFMVFGESLFNDGVTVVLYNTMNTLLQVPEIGITEGLMAVLAFFFVAFGGALIGFISGLFASYVTRFTQQVRVVEPLVFFSIAYLAFLCAEIVHWSGIISIIAYGITVKRYGFPNYSSESYTTVKYAIKTLASTSDCIIFLFLGTVLIQEDHHLHWTFIVATIALCLVFRFIGVFIFSALVNLRRVNKIVPSEQFIMAYGGLRGAVGFSLAVVLSKDVWYRELFVTTALAMVFFTVFLQGSTIKLFVKCLNIKLNKDKDDLLTVEVNCSMIDDVMDGLETIIGRKTKAKGVVTSFFSYIDDKLADAFGTDTNKDLLRKYEKIMLDEHFTNLYAPRLIAKQDTEAVDGVKGLNETDEGVVTRRSSINIVDTKKSFREGLRNSNWEKFRHPLYSNDSASKWLEVSRQLELRRERVKTMEDKILTPELRRRINSSDDPVNEGWKDEKANGGGQDNRPATVARSASANWASLSRASKRAIAVKSEYDKVQREKSASAKPSQRKLSLQEIPEESESATLLKRVQLTRGQSHDSKEHNPYLSPDYRAKGGTGSAK